MRFEGGASLGWEEIGECKKGEVEILRGDKSDSCPHPLISLSPYPPFLHQYLVGSECRRGVVLAAAVSAE